ncbi:hypothetical protein COV17_00600 [Candidatus Woesearchaeota archaeon CG10_big_fil_rev_8_21_14_0_10_36_11]|nr:MAG: hypothetical protein COV17_00600 [Candidatus Woesearchaeota archaeon CG10_big_fil_rev_8_21_14_0_10_36_11]
MPILTKSAILKFYKRRDIQDAIIIHAKNKEIGMRFGDGFGKRPDVLTYPRDILELALQGVTSLHASEEIWDNPLAISSDLSKKELNELRIGWDLMLDIDCAILEYSRICADLVIQFLTYCGVKDISVKFSGNKGFHIGVPFEAFPTTVGNEKMKDMFPDAPRKIALYIKENIKEELGKRIMQLENNNFSSIVEKTKTAKEDITYYKKNEMGTQVPHLNVEPFLEIDTILLSSRHLYRMPYSFHEKSGLVSLPIDPFNVMEFEKSMAMPEKVLTPMFTFLDRNCTGESARNLLVQALDFKVKAEDEEPEKRDYEEISITSPITEEFFPPCIQYIFKGMDDGKKRGMFILSNFLGKLGWQKKDIEQFILRWNPHNPEQLRMSYIKGQLSSFTPGNKLPPNCSNDAYYTGIGICHPDRLCKYIKNPVNYTIAKWRRHLRDNEEKKPESE